MSSYNPSKTTWMNPNIQYLFNDEVIEYDMRDAGFSLIKQYHLLPSEKILELERLGKGVERHITIGKLQRDDKEFSKRLLDKFAEVRAIFISANNITDNDIISVKKDAIFTIGTCNRLKFGNVEFSEKNRYTSYIRFPDINNLEIYYSIDTMDIKGMGDHAVNRHRLYMFKFIKSIIEMIENSDPRAKRVIMRFIDNYKSHNLDDEFYVEFNNMSRDINPIFNYKNIIIPLVNIILKEMN